MSTAQLERAAPVAADARTGVLDRVGRLRHTSPGRLQLILAALVSLALLTGLVTGLTAAAAADGTDDLGNRAQPLLVEAETIYSALADADTTAAQAFLAGGLEPTALTRRYEDDLDRANAALTSAARRTPEQGRSADAIRRLSADVTRYAGLVSSARANNRQGLPIGASYLSSASALSRDSLQPQAQALLQAARSEVDDGYGAARSSWWAALLVILLIALLGALLRAQLYLSRATHRTFNLPLVAATAGTVVLALAVGGVLIAQRAHLSEADTEGSRPVALLAEARIAALRERGDEALTLAARSGEGTLEVDFDTTTGRLNELLSDASRSTVDSYPSLAVRSAITKHGAYVSAHDQVRELDNGGDYDGAVALAIGPQTSQIFTGVTDDIGRALENRKDVFSDEISDAGRGLGPLTVLGPLLALIVCGLIIAGLRARLEEYR
ncbi:hypothetical protein ACFQFC_39990 [Amorphoplanes digitatis]|uniref:Secreted protein n=1 Tax=Actinoplanes digitatis TaxID=1868 RepID=A0A7W7HX70_9ACTN|nr:hypothetical protein [Actinoplanes digitatis]MBB4762356.1 hypothetical protein [Actinoplanes digitatis]GID92522.1 hypothetical protein Adi01nite_19340 [Actinoplanes digitatis]